MRQKIGAYCEVAHSLVEPRAEIGSKSYLTYTIAEIYIGKKIDNNLTPRDVNELI